MEEVGLTQEQVAEKVGKSRSTVTNVLRLLKLPPRVQASLREGTLSSGHARTLVGIEDPDELLSLHREILDDGLSVREVERRAKVLREGGPEPTATTARTALAPAVEPLDERDRLQVEALEARLRDHVATQVRIRHRAGDGGGTIEIAYYSVDDLERVVDRLLGS